MNGPKVVIVDYGLGNLYSVRRAFEVIGANDICISSSPAEISAADRLLLPGVGAFGDGMQGLREKNLDRAICEFSESGKPLLGICLGMQLLSTLGTEFGEHKGLGLIPGKVDAIPLVSEDGLSLKAPYIGWSSLNCPNNIDWGASVLADLTQEQSVYLVHSNHVIPDNPNDVLATYQYGGRKITAAVTKNNITGLQFHPEKSGEVGLKILRRFCAIL